MKILCILLFSVCVLFYQIDRYPVNVSVFEGYPAIAAMDGEIDWQRPIKGLYGSRGCGWNPFLVYPMMVVGWYSPIGIRVVPIVYSVLSVWLIYLLGSVFSKRVGLVSACLLATSCWFIALSRLCSDFSATVFFSLVCLYTYSKCKVFGYILLGGLLALGTYFYLPARVMPAIVLFAIFGRIIFDRGYFKSAWAGIILMCVAFQFVCWLEGIDSFKYFTDLINKRGNECFWKHGGFNTLIANFGYFWRLFFARWGWTGMSIAYERNACLDPITRYCVGVGALLCILRLKKYRLVLIWGVLALMPLLLTYTRGKRGLLLIPVFCMLASIGICGAYKMLVEWSNGKRFAKIVGSIGILVLLVFIGRLNMINYFGEYERMEERMLKKGSKWKIPLQILREKHLYTDKYMAEASPTLEYLARCDGTEDRLHQSRKPEQEFAKAKGPAVLLLQVGERQEK